MALQRYASQACPGGSWSPAKLARRSSVAQRADHRGLTTGSWSHCREKQLSPPITRPRTNLHSCCAAPNFNPQNVPDPQVMPNKDVGPEEAVRAQLDALQNNDNPWPNHGLQTAYEFGEDIGGLERSRYFGYSKDLYHFDHFLGQFQNAFPELVGLTSYSIKSVEETPPDEYTVKVDVERHSARARLTFILVRKDIGRKKGALMTKTLLKA